MTIKTKTVRNKAVTIRDGVLINPAAYLIGVPGECFSKEVYDSLNKPKKNRGVRHLMTLRTSIFQNFSEISDAFRIGTPIDKITKIGRLYDDVLKDGFCIKSDGTLYDLVIEINKILEESAEEVIKNLFPEECRRWILNMLLMPDGNSVDGVKTALRKYKINKGFYPYQRYINWNFSGMTEEEKTKYILSDDESFLKLLKEQNVKDEKKDEIIGRYFADSEGGVVLCIDCENNGNPEGMFSFIQKYKRNISKCILVDDIHTSVLWNEVESSVKNLGMDVERIEVKRLKEQKSLVDFKILQTVMKEFYESKTNNFVLVSSDSDIWSVLESLPDAHFMVLAERSRCGEKFLSLLNERSIPNVFVEDVIGAETVLTEKTIMVEAIKLASNFYYDAKRTVTIASMNLQIPLTDEQIREYAENIISNLELNKNLEDGTVNLIVS